MAILARLLFALFFGAAAAFLMWATRQAITRRGLWMTNGVVVNGEVVGFKEEPRAATRAGRVPVAPIIAYRTGAGVEPRRFTSAEAHFPNPFVLGQQVRVRYMTDEGRPAELDEVARSWRFILAVGALATACLIVALIPLVVIAMELRQ